MEAVPAKPNARKLGECLEVSQRVVIGQYPQRGRQYGIKNKAAIALQRKSDVKFKAALLFIAYITPM